MLNTAIIMGRICNDLELRQTPSSVPVTRFSVAVDRGYAKQGEEKKTDFIDVVCWRQNAEFVTKYFSKGQMIAIQGEIQTGSYEKDGITRKTFEIVADSVSFCGGKNEGQGGNASPSEPQTTTGSFAPLAEDDDLPF